jgi:2-methylcitrate dehydratase
VETEHETVTDGRMVTRELAAWVSQLQYEDLPDAVTHEAAMAFTDFLGECLLVGGTKAWGQSVAAFAAKEGGGQPEATVIALGEKTLASRAAFANGTMALGFEYADWGAGSRPYPFAVTGPLALAEARGLSGKQFLLAVVIGYELMWRMHKAFFIPGRHSGFYVPSVYGTVASSGACARLLGLDVQNTLYALGLGCAFAGGTFQGHEEGAWQRSLNGGMAGERGVTAAQMAETGFKATELGLEGIQGFASMYTGGHLDADAMLEGLGPDFDDFVITKRWVKRYPMNTTLHAPVESLLKVMREHDLKHTDIVEISAAWQKVEPFLAKHAVTAVPAAQASLPFALAVASVHRKATIDEFTDETVADPVVREMMQKVTVHQDPDLLSQIGHYPGKVVVRTTDGRELTGAVENPKGSPNNRLTEAEFKEKFMEMGERVLGHDQADELYRRSRDVGSVANVAELAPLFSRR